MKFQIYRTCMQREAASLVSKYPVLLDYNLHDEVVGSDKLAYISISSIAKLQQLVKDIKNPVIIEYYDDQMTLEIYDDWRE